MDKAMDQTNVVKCVAGLYASISSMAKNGATNKPFNCANNAAR